MYEICDERQILDTNHFRPQPRAQQRRSQRILLAVTIQISGQRDDGSPFSERTITQIVNAHGALILLREPVTNGQKLVMKHLGTNEEMPCTVMDLNPPTIELPEIGVGFAEPCPDFWRVSFPPEDWSPRTSQGRLVPAQEKKPTTSKI
jgi:hypothetical protein